MNKKNKVGIISIHYGVNFGSALQAYALYSYITNNFKNYDVEIINYIPKRFKYIERFKNRKSKDFIHTLKWLYNSIFFEFMNYKYNNFLKKNTKISPKIYNIEDARKRYKDYNFLIAGSDQIWNTDYNKGIDGMYYLDFASSKTKKISYAASCGKDDYSKEEWKSIIKHLNTFDMISLREKQDVDLFGEHKINNCCFVLDPTYLYNKKEWGLIEKKLNINCNYVLIYLLDVDGKEIIEKAKEYAHNRNLKTVMVCTGLCKNKYKVDHIFNKLTPEYYIYLIKNASLVFTNSFHGTSFSINMEKQFVVFKRNNYNKRIDNILNVLNLKNRCIKIDDDINKLGEIDYSKVNKRKEQLVEESKSFLDESLK